MSNTVFIANSLDGYIADRNGGLGWLESVPNPDNADVGIEDFFGRIDAIVMGRNTFQTVAAMNVPWPYPVPVFVWSATLETLPDSYREKAAVVRGSPAEIIGKLAEKGYKDLYIDGGKTIQAFLQADLIDEMILTRIPVLLGGGTPLFGELSGQLIFKHVSTEVHLGELVMSRYRRKR